MSIFLSISISIYGYIHYQKKFSYFSQRCGSYTDYLSIKHFSHQVRHLDVRRNAFAGITVDGTFQMMEVTMEKIPSLAFDFDYVRDFIIDRSRIDRVAMWGIKPQKCDSFSILGGSRLYSLGTNALELRCNKFMLGYNTFDR